MSKHKLNLVQLDVRPQLRQKIEPFQMIMDTVKKLHKDDALVLHATFKPTPLLGLLKLKGYINHVEKKANDHWIVTFVKKKNKYLLAELTGQDEWALEDEQDALLNRTTNGSASEEENVKADSSLDGPAKTVTLDNRGLQPPQPMMRTLAALDRCEPGDEVNIHNDRVPMFLIDELNQLGYAFHVEEQSDGSAKVNIKKS